MGKKEKIILTSDMPEKTEVATKDLIAMLVILNGGANAFTAQDINAMAGMMATITKLLGDYLPEAFELSEEHIEYVKGVVKEGGGDIHVRKQ